MTSVKSLPEAAASDDACRVLIVEDNITLARLLEMALVGYGHDVQIARNGTEALTVAATFRPNVALIDLGLPGLDGLYVTKELRKSHDDILIIATTGRDSPEDVERSRAAGCDHHLVKPVDLNQIVALLQKWKSKGGCEMQSTHADQSQPGLFGRRQ
jgi:CheY-like chemotaxis protein